MACGLKPITYAKNSLELRFIYATRSERIAIILTHGEGTEPMAVTVDIETAITQLQAELESYPEDGDPAEWAWLHVRLGDAYRKRLYGEQSTNLEMALRSYLAALQVYAADTYPSAWAKIHMRLGIVYFNRILGDESENIEAAIYAYEAALTVYRRDTTPAEWATTHYNLGSAYLSRVIGDRVVNLRTASLSYESALEVFTAEMYPSEYARVREYLGLVARYLDQLQGEDAVDKAVYAYHSAVMASNPMAMSGVWMKPTY